MFYYLFQFLDQLDVPGAGLFNYISFRTALALITSLIISMIYGKKLIIFLRRKQVGETIRQLDLEGQNAKAGTPTMGGIIIIAAILVPVLFFTKLHNVYIVLMLITTIWLGLIGFIDDYIKVFFKKKDGLKGRFKLFGQIVLGFIIGITIYLNDDIVIRQNPHFDENHAITIVNGSDQNQQQTQIKNDTKSLKTTLPFLKNNEIDYSKIVWFLNGKYQWIAWFIFILIVTFIVTSVSNGANITDGLDGLAAGSSAIIGSVLGIFAYVSGNMIFAEYLKIMYIPNVGELVVFAGAFVGATVGFLWYNSYPAQIFMGDTGSLTIGGIIAVFAILIRKELLIPVLCGIFFIESISVILQVSYYKHTLKKFGEGRRIFLMAPLHHHFQKKGIHEAKIVARFLIVGIILALVSILTLKIR